MPIPEFVLEIRKSIGHSLLWLPGVTAIVFDPQDRLLMVRRVDDGSWTPVTGIVEPGEEPAATAVREVAEETGVSIEVERLCSIGVGEPVTYANGDRAQYLDHTFRCRYLAGEAHVADDESSDVAWFPILSLPATPPRFLPRIEAAKSATGPAEFDH